MKESGYEALVVNSFESTVRVLLGDASSKALWAKLETEFSVGKNDICAKANDLSSSLDHILGRAGPVVRRSSVRNLYLKLGMRYKPQFDLKEELDYARQIYERSAERRPT